MFPTTVVVWDVNTCMVPECCDPARVSMFPTTVVLWDVNTCPVPEGYDPARVRQSIEWALIKRCGIGRVAIFAVGNLEHISPRVLKDISSSGILLRHTPAGGADVEEMLADWKMRTRPPANILLITSDDSWLAMDSTPEYTLFHAIPDPSPRYDYSCGCGYRCEWFWETLLQENSAPVETSGQKHNDEPAWFCTVCTLSSQSCDDFISHLKSRRHKHERLTYVPIDENKNPTFFCKLCDYPGYDRWNMCIHYDSEEHAQKEMEDKSRRGSSEKEAPLVYQQPNTTQEEDCANSSLEQGGQGEIKMVGEGRVITRYLVEYWNEDLKAAKESKKLIVIHFTATWLHSLYPPSRLIRHIVREYAKKFLNVVFLEANVDTLGSVAEEFDVEKLPTFIFMRQDKILDRVIRPQVVGAAIDEIRMKLETHLGGVASA